MVNLQHLIQTPQTSGYFAPSKWTLVRRKPYKAYFTFITNPPTKMPHAVMLKNRHLQASFPMPAQSFVMCRPYGDVRLVDAQTLSMFANDNGQRGTEALKKHAKNVLVANQTEPQLVIPWSPLTSQEHEQNINWLALKLDKKQFKDVAVTHGLAAKQFGGNGCISNSLNPKINNGTGDYLVAPQAGTTPDGKPLPDLNRLEIINGRTFTEMFDMRAFPGENIETGVDAYEKPEELSKFTSLEDAQEKYSVLELFKQAEKQGIIIKTNEHMADAFENVRIATLNGVPITSEEDFSKKLKRPVIVDVDIPQYKATARITLKNVQDVKDLIMGNAKSITLTKPVSEKVTAQSQKGYARIVTLAGYVLHDR